MTDTAGYLNERALEMTYMGFGTWLGDFGGESKAVEVPSGVGGISKQGQAHDWVSISTNLYREADERGG